MPYPFDSLRKLAKNTEKNWVKLSKKTISDSHYIDIHESHLVKIFANDVENFHEIKALDVACWEQILYWLANESRVSLHQDTINYVAQRLYREFPQRFRDVLKHNADNGGEAFAQMLLNLHGEALVALKEVKKENQQIIDALEEIAKHKDVAIVFHTMQLRFNNTDDLIKQLLKEIQQIKLQSSENTQNQQYSQQGKRLFISYKRDAQPDEKVALQIAQALSPQHKVFIDQKILIGTHWAELIEAEIRSCDFLIVLLSEYSAHSEMVETEIRMAHNFAQMQSGQPTILPIRLAYRQPFQYPLSAYLNHINWAYWSDEQDTPHLIEELKQAISGSKSSKELSFSTQQKTELLLSNAPEFSDLPRPSPSAQPGALEIPEGTMKLKSAFYVEREADRIALNTIIQQGVTISIKGPRQVGKSSLFPGFNSLVENKGRR